MPLAIEIDPVTFTFLELSVRWYGLIGAAPGAVIWAGGCRERLPSTTLTREASRP